MSLLQRNRTNPSIAFYGTPLEQRATGAAVITAKHFGPWTSRYLSISTGYTAGNGVGVSRHIFDMATTFYPHNGGATPGGRSKTIYDHTRSEEKDDKKSLSSLFPTAQFYCRRGVRDKWAIVHDKPKTTVGVGGAVGGACQAVCTYAKGVGICKAVTGLCIGVLPGALVATMGGGVLATGLVLVSGRGADDMLLYDAKGPIALPSDHIANLQKQHAWKVGKYKPEI